MYNCQQRLQAEQQKRMIVRFSPVRHAENFSFAAIFHIFIKFSLVFHMFITFHLLECANVLVVVAWTVKSAYA